jgi:parvulin-like peptidyl-prolyl isomerase
LAGNFKSKYLEPLIENVSVSPEEVRQYYESHREEFTRPPSVRLAMLYSEARSKMPPEKRETIRERMAGARESALGLSDEKDFGKLSIAFSEHQASRYRGGDVGWVREEGMAEIAKEATDAGFALENIGDVSEVVSADDGFYVVKLMDRRQPEAIPFEKAEKKITRALLLEKRKQVEEEFYELKRAGIAIKIYPEALAGVEAQDPASGGEKPPALP